MKEYYKMKNLIQIFKLFIIAGLTYCFYSCSMGIPTGDEQTNKDLFVDFRTYSVSYPVGDDWSCTTDRINELVSFSRYKHWLTGVVVGETFIKVWKNEIKSDTFSLNEKQTADDYRNNELKIMKEVGVKKGQYELEDVVLFDTIVNEKKFYCMSYTTTSGSIFSGFTSEAILALYFPPDFKEKKSFYQFLISDGKKRGFWLGIEASQIYPVLKSFNLKKQ